MEGSDEMQLNTYNGWENKFTWLVDLHLSNDADVMEEVTKVAAYGIDEQNAGGLVEAWVKSSIENWCTFWASRRGKGHDEEFRLLVWDLLGSALAYADWENLVRAMMHEIEVGENLFTEVLYRNIESNHQLRQDMMTLVGEASSIYTGMDAVREWFELQLEIWITTLVARRQQSSPMSVLARDLILAVVCWKHIARVFREGC